MRLSGSDFCFRLKSLHVARKRFYFGSNHNFLFPLLKFNLKSPEYESKADGKLKKNRNFLKENVFGSCLKEQFHYRKKKLRTKFCIKGAFE